MGLDQKTAERLRQLFARQRCCRCGAPAARLRDGRYYCHGHFLAERRESAEGAYRADRLRS